MTNAKLFARLRTLIEDATDADKQHIKKIRKVLRKLKKRQQELLDSLEEVENPHKRQKIEQEIEVITLQRGKGVEVYKQLKSARKSSKQEKSRQAPGATTGGGAAKSTPEDS